MQQRNDLEFYNRVAHEWWSESAKIYALHHLNPPRFAYFNRYLPDWTGLRVLDVGCGGGFTCEFLAQQGALASGIDQSAACIAAAQDHAAARQLAIDYRHGHAELLPYADHSFDAVICVDVLEHVDDVGQTVSEIHRVLKPGGLFCFDTINRTFKSKLVMIWLLEDWLRQIPRGIHDWNKFIAPKELESLLRGTGFDAIEFAGFNIFGETALQNVGAYLHYLRTREFRIGINQDTSVMYIGKARKRLEAFSEAPSQS